MSEPLLIFVAGPYTNPSAPERERNVSVVHGVVKQLMMKGHIVLECHSLEHSFYGDSELTHADFLRQTVNWISRCDAVYFISASPGANIELLEAESRGLKLFRSLDEVPVVSDLNVAVEAVRRRLESQTGQQDEP